MKQCARRGLEAGFSLIELMIVVVVIAILAAIAIPNYREYVVESRRESAGACLVESAQAMERRYTECLRYDQARNAATPPVCVDATGDPPPPCGQLGELNGHYAAPAFAALGQRAFTLSIAPQGAQASADTTCGTLSLDNQGRKGASISGANANECF